VAAYRQSVAWGLALVTEEPNDAAQRSELARARMKQSAAFSPKRRSARLMRSLLEKVISSRLSGVTWCCNTSHSRGRPDVSPARTNQGNPSARAESPSRNRWPISATPIASREDIEFHSGLRTVDQVGV
jgi:hypothetical protein